MADFITDTFSTDTHADGTQLVNHTSDNSVTYSSGAGSPSDLQIFSDTLYILSPVAFTRGDPSADPPGDDYQIAITMDVVGGATAVQKMAVYMRADTLRQNAYYMEIGDTGAASISKVVSSSPTTLASNSGHTFAADDVIIFRVQGTTLTILQNGSSILSTTDGTFTTAGKVSFVGITDTTGTAHWGFKDWTAGDIPSSGDLRRRRVLI